MLVHWIVAHWVTASLQLNEPIAAHGENDSINFDREMTLLCEATQKKRYGILCDIWLIMSIQMFSNPAKWAHNSTVIFHSGHLLVSVPSNRHFFRLCVCVCVCRCPCSIHRFINSTDLMLCKIIIHLMTSWILQFLSWKSQCPMRWRNQDIHWNGMQFHRWTMINDAVQSTSANNNPQPHTKSIHLDKPNSDDSSFKLT